MARPKQRTPVLRDRVLRVAVQRLATGGVGGFTTRRVAEEYLKYLYSKPGQEIAAKHFYRPRDPAVAAQYAAQFVNIPQLVTIDAVFGGWTKAQATHFADHGTFDRIYGQ